MWQGRMAVVREVHDDGTLTLRQEDAESFEMRDVKGVSMQDVSHKPEVLPGPMIPIGSTVRVEWSPSEQGQGLVTRYIPPSYPFNEKYIIQLDGGGSMFADRKDITVLHTPAPDLLR